jgi:hypothetical protein
MICRECKQDLPEINFWEVRIGRNQHIRHNKCKDCSLKEIDINKIDTLIPLCKELNFPFIKSELRHITNYSNFPLTSRGLVGRYLSKMKLASFRYYLFEDSEMLNKIDEEREKEAMRRRGFNV